MSKKWLWLIIVVVAVVGFALGLYTRGAEGFHIPGLPLFVYVDIQGDVQNPGIYKFLRGARICHAIEAAGWPMGSWVLGEEGMPVQRLAAIRIIARTSDGKSQAAGLSVKLKDEMTLKVERVIEQPARIGLGPPPEPPTPVETEITVDVTGAVGNPGVYTLPAGSRVQDAIEAAGGLASDANGDWPTFPNRASELHDGQQVQVPRKF